jgi:hypothetical protein
MLDFFNQPTSLSFVGLLSPPFSPSHASSTYLYPFTCAGDLTLLMHRQPQRVEEHRRLDLAALLFFPAADGVVGRGGPPPRSSTSAEGASFPAPMRRRAASPTSPAGWELGFSLQRLSSSTGKGWACFGGADLDLRR